MRISCDHRNIRCGGDAVGDYVIYAFSNEKLCDVLGNPHNYFCREVERRFCFLPRNISLYPIRKVKDVFCLIDMDALKTFDVRCSDFASTLESSSVVSYGTGILRLSVRFQLIHCDMEFSIFAPTLRWVVNIQCSGLKDVCNKCDQLDDSTVVRWYPSSAARPRLRRVGYACTSRQS